jgi:hypothetical protein
MEDIEKNDYNLNISRYVSTAKPEQETDLAAVHAQRLSEGIGIAAGVIRVTSGKERRRGRCWRGSEYYR